VRTEDATDEGQPIDFQRLADAVADGVLPESAYVRGPQDAGWRLVGDHPDLEEHLPPKSLFRSRAAEEAEMDMTPMIDVTFQLLIFFMITAAFVTQKTLDMPQSKSEGAARRVTQRQLAENNVVVKLHANGTIAVGDKQTTLEEFPRALGEAMKGRVSAEVYLDVDDDVEHEGLVQVLDGAAGANVQRVHFIRHVSGGPAKAGG